MAQEYELSLIKVNLLAAWAVNNAEPFLWHYSDQLATWWQVNYVETFPFWKGQWFFLTGKDTYTLRMAFSFSTSRAHINNTI